jgi:2-keto-3-deoxy-6-phosphogluconate aldolase
MVVAAEEAGFRFIEITLDSPEALKMIASVVRECPGLTVGAGTVHTADEVKKNRRRWWTIYCCAGHF